MSQSTAAAPQPIQTYPPRIRAFRDETIRTVPRVPNNKKTQQQAEAMPTRQLILAYITWRMRAIPAKPRKIGLFNGGITTADLVQHHHDVGPLLIKVEKGDDISGHLSELARTAGMVFPSTSRGSKGDDLDTTLIRYGLHHFHLGTPNPKNPKGRSDKLLFAEVLEDEFRVVAISDHSAFTLGTPEHTRLFRIAWSYIARDVPVGQGFMANPVMTSGHSLTVTLFADKCEALMDALDPKLDDPAYIAKLYSDGGLKQPKKSKLKWYFNDLVFGLYDEPGSTFFILYPFFQR